MHEHGQRMEDIKAHLGVLHNSFMEVNDCLNDLDAGRCRCRDVPLSLVLGDPQVSPSISAVGGGEEVVPLLTMVEENGCDCLFGCVVKGHGGVDPSELTCPQIVVDWRDTNLMEELRESGDIVDGWEMPGPHEQ